MRKKNMDRRYKTKRILKKADLRNKIMANVIAYFAII